MKGTRTALDLESEDMEDVALQFEEQERYSTAELFYHPEDAESVASSVGLLMLESGYGSESIPVVEDVPEDEDNKDEEEEEEEEVEIDDEASIYNEEYLAKISNKEESPTKIMSDFIEEIKKKEEKEEEKEEVHASEESICEGPVGTFAFSALDNLTTVSTLGSPSVAHNFRPPAAVETHTRIPLYCASPQAEKEHKVENKKVAFAPEPETVDIPRDNASNASDSHEYAQTSFRGLLCNHPCGKLEIAAMLLSLTAFVLTGSATDRCDFLVLENENLQTFWDIPERTVGLLQFETLAADAATTHCLYWFDYPDAAGNLYDGLWHAARFMSMAAMFFGLFLVGFISTFSCIAYRVIVFQRLAFAALLMPLLHGLSFIVFGSDVCIEGACEVGIGGLLMILGSIMWLMLAAVLQKIASAQSQMKDKKETLAVARHGLRLGLAMVVLVVAVAVVDVAMTFRSAPSQPRVAGSSSDEVASISSDWQKAGITTQGPYPDSPNFLSLSGDATIMSLIGKESVSVQQFDATRKLWYPFGNMIAANLDPSGLESGDRTIRFTAASSAVSYDGHTIAVGSSNWAKAGEEGTTYEFGTVQIWKYHADSKRWIPKGRAIMGKSKGDAFASQVKLSKDGHRLAVLGSGRFGKQQPYVRVYQFDESDGGSWAQVGDEITLATFWTPSGFAFSSDGMSVALGSLRIGRLGLVSAWHYQPDTDSWMRLGSPISSGSSSREDQFGESVAMSGNGKVLVIGDPGSPSFARVYWRRDGEWQQLGADILCGTPKGRCAQDIAISETGSAIAMTENSLLPTVRVYTWDKLEKQWIQAGDDIIGSTMTAEGTAMGLSSDGRTVAFGVTVHDTKTQVWQYDGILSLNDELEEVEGNPTPTLLAPTEAPGPAVVPTMAPSSMIPTKSMAQTSAPAVAFLSNYSAVSVSNFTKGSNSSSIFISTSSIGWNMTHPAVLNTSAMPHEFEDFEEPEQSVATAPLEEIDGPWVSSTVRGDIAYFLFESLPRVERFDMSTRSFLPPLKLPIEHGPATALGVDDYNRVYVGYGEKIFRYAVNGTDEVEIAAEAKTAIIGFQFDGDLVFINAGKYFISLDGESNTLIKQFFSFNEMEHGTSIASGKKRIFGRTPDEVAKFSGDVVRKSDLWFKEYNAAGDFVDEKLAPSDRKVGFKSASRTWMFPDQTRVVDDMGYVFSVASAEHVYTIETSPILDIAWLGGEVMIALHENGTITSISQELVETGLHRLEVAPSNLAAANGQVFTFTYHPSEENGIRVDDIYLGLLKPAIPGRLVNATGVPFTPEFVFVDNDSLLYMLSKGHSSIFVMDPKDKTYLESIRLAEIPKYVAYSDVNREIYTFREDGVLSKIDLASRSRDEIPITTLPSTPLGLSTAGEFIFVCDDSGAFTTHYTFSSNGTLISSVGMNHYDKEYVWSEVNRKMYFFRQADPTDLMTEHIFLNGTIGNRVDSFLNTNDGFEHPIRVDPFGHHAVLGSGVIHNAKTLKRLNVTLANAVLDTAFGKGMLRTVRNIGDKEAQVQQWHGHTFELQNATSLDGQANRILALGENEMIVLTTDVTGVPVAYVVDEQFHIA